MNPLHLYAAMPSWLPLAQQGPLPSPINFFPTCPLCCLSQPLPAPCHFRVYLLHLLTLHSCWLVSPPHLPTPPGPPLSCHCSTLPYLSLPATTTTPLPPNTFNNSQLSLKTPICFYLFPLETTVERPLCKVIPCRHPAPPALPCAVSWRRTMLWALCRPGFKRFSCSSPGYLFHSACILT